VVSAQAAGAIQPDTTVEVKSKASGEILKLYVETGQVVKRGAPLVLVDPRNARNALAQAQADLDVAKAQLENATSQKRRADELFRSQSITQQEHEQAQLDYANAKGAVVRAQVALDNAKIQSEDTDVRAPIAGTIIEKDVERGTVIASATNNVSGGTTLLKMADLNLVQVNTLVDETDIGKVQAGQLATVTVDAFPNRTFDGTVLKIEPQAQTQQNVTVFPVLIRIDNRLGLLRPGMNTEVEIHVGERDSVLAVPNAALRTQRDVGSAALVLGLSADQVQEQLAASAPPRGAAQASGSFGGTDGEPRDSLRRRAGATSDSGARVTRADSGFRGRADSGMRRRFAGNRTGGGGGFMRQARSTDAGGGRYIVFAKRAGAPAPMWIRTGLTDLDYSEVLQGLKEGDSVYVLPSASLVQSQQDMRQRFNQITGGGAVPGMRQQTPASPGGAGGGGAGGGPGR
jgi:HlyD family secretion protein